MSFIETFGQSFIRGATVHTNNITYQRHDVAPLHHTNQTLSSPAPESSVGQAIYIVQYHHSDMYRTIRIHGLTSLSFTVFCSDLALASKC